MGIIKTATDGPCSIETLGNLPIPSPSSLLYRTNDKGETVVLGIEGSANKVGVSVLVYNPNRQTYEIKSNPRKTYIPPIGHGFLPKETAWHHQAHIVGTYKHIHYS